MTYFQLPDETIIALHLIKRICPIELAEWKTDEIPMTFKQRFTTKTSDIEYTGKLYFEICWSDNSHSRVFSDTITWMGAFNLNEFKNDELYILRNELKLSLNMKN